MNRVKKDIKPVKLWTPDYNKRTPESLFKTVLKRSEFATRSTLALTRPIAPNIEVYANTDVLKTMATGPAVWVFNHQDFSDPVVVGAVAHRLGLPLPRFAAMAELFDEDHPLFAQYVASNGGFPLDRAELKAGKKDAITQFFRITDYILTKQKEPIVLFPEGGIFDKPKGYENKVSDVTDTAMRIAKRNKLPLVVGGLAGTRYLALKAPLPPKMKKVGVALTHVYGYDALPKNANSLRSIMQKEANIALAVSKES